MNPEALEMGPTMKGTNNGPPRAKDTLCRSPAAELSPPSPAAAITASRSLPLIDDVQC